MDIYDILLNYFLEWKRFHKKIAEKLKIRILCSITFSPKIVPFIIEDNIIWRMRFASWITKATNTQVECLIRCFSTATMVTRTRLDVTLNLLCLCCWYVSRSIETSCPPRPSTSWRAKGLCPRGGRNRSYVRNLCLYWYSNG